MGWKILSVKLLDERYMTSVPEIPQKHGLEACTFLVGKHVAIKCGPYNKRFGCLLHYLPKIYHRRYMSSKILWVEIREMSVRQKALSLMCKYLIGNSYKSLRKHFSRYFISRLKLIRFFISKLVTKVRYIVILTKPFSKDLIEIMWNLDVTMIRSNIWNLESAGSGLFELQNMLG